MGIRFGSPILLATIAILVVGTAAAAAVIIFLTVGDKGHPPGGYGQILPQ